MGILSRLFGRKQVQQAEPKAPTEPAPAQAKPAPAPAEPAQVAMPKITTHKVAGTSYRQEAIQAMGILNPDYNLTKRELTEDLPDYRDVFEYDFYPQKVDLVPEPENPHDPKAIKVIIDDVHVGYIKAGSCAHIHRLLRENRIKKIDAYISGGKYKSVYSYEDNPRKAADYVLDKGSTTIGVRLEITELPATKKSRSQPSTL